jgi:hypothetical protein
MPKTYDEINRKTIPNPDSSWRPSPEQVKQAHEGFRAMDADEQQLHARVVAALSGTGVNVEVDRDRVRLRGQVDQATLASAADTVRGVDGVGSVDDQLTSH